MHLNILFGIISILLGFSAFLLFGYYEHDRKRISNLELYLKSHFTTTFDISKIINELSKQLPKYDVEVSDIEVVVNKFVSEHKDGFTPIIAQHAACDKHIRYDSVLSCSGKKVTLEEYVQILHADICNIHTPRKDLKIYPGQYEFDKLAIAIWLFNQSFDAKKLQDCFRYNYRYWTTHQPCFSGPYTNPPENNTIDWLKYDYLPDTSQLLNLFIVKIMKKRTEIISMSQCSHSEYSCS